MQAPVPPARHLDQPVGLPLRCALGQRQAARDWKDLSEVHGQHADTFNTGQCHLCPLPPREKALPPIPTRLYLPSPFLLSPPMMTESILCPPLPPLQLRSKLFQKNCASCTRSHRRCKFESPGDRQCMRCCKMHLTCFFLPSGELIDVGAPICRPFFQHFFHLSYHYPQSKVAAMISSRSHVKPPPDCSNSSCCRWFT